MDRDWEDEVLFLPIQCTHAYQFTFAAALRVAQKANDNRSTLDRPARPTYLYRYVNISFHSCSTSRVFTYGAAQSLAISSHQHVTPILTHPWELGLLLMNLAYH